MFRVYLPQAETRGHSLRTSERYKTCFKYLAGSVYTGTEKDTTNVIRGTVHAHAVMFACKCCVIVL
jgi:hypothetical protein